MVLVPPALLLSTQLLITVADQVPYINVEPSCRAAVAAFGMGQDVKSCMEDEKAAHDQLAKQWNQFPAADRTGCLSLTKTGSSGTYTDFLTCLEIKRDARRLSQEPGLDSGRGAARPRSGIPFAPHQQPTPGTVGAAQRNAQ
jgi:hypothetical protein